MKKRLLNIGKQGKGKFRSSTAAWAGYAMSRGLGIAGLALRAISLHSL
ncbi:MAG: hypothetical protein WCA63_08965 [Gallionella sp.]